MYCWSSGTPGPHSISASSPVKSGRLVAGSTPTALMCTNLKYLVGQMLTVGWGAAGGCAGCFVGAAIGATVAAAGGAVVAGALVGGIAGRVRRVGVLSTL